MLARLAITKLTENPLNLFFTGLDPFVWRAQRKEGHKLIIGFPVKNSPSRNWGTAPCYWGF